MTDILSVHPTHPQARAVARAVECIRVGGVVAYPTDSSYALGCHLGDGRALERLGQIRRVGRAHNYTLVCRSLADIGHYARLDNDAYRWIKPHVPGAFTFILRASAATPRRVQHGKRRTIGVRVPDHPVVAALLGELGEPLLSTTLMLPGDDAPLDAADDIAARLNGRIELVIDAGPCGDAPTTVIELVSGQPEVVRVGRGDAEPFR